MTRINCVEPSELHGRHLLAEYRELPRVFGLALNKLSGSADFSDIPQNYTMGKGHVKFFYDKIEYLYKRQLSLIDELKSRGYNITHEDPAELVIGLYQTKLWNDWVPSAVDVATSRKRISERLIAMGVKLPERI